MPYRCPRPGGAAGFSLIEVLVALAIGGLALSAIAGVIGDGLAGGRTDDAAATALTIAEGEIAASGAAEPLRPGTNKGSFAGRFEWLRRVTVHEDGQTGEAAGDQPLARFQLYRIEVTVGWSEGARRRQLTLATLRLAPVLP